MTTDDRRRSGPGVLLGRDPNNAEQTAAMVRAALAEAGWPHADVYTDEDNVLIYVDGPPWDVVSRAFDLVNEHDQRAAP